MGNPYVLIVKLKEPSPANNPINIGMGMVSIRVLADGGGNIACLGVKVAVYEGADPPDPCDDLIQDPVDKTIWQGSVIAPCSNTMPYPQFRIYARGEFEDPGGMGGSVFANDDAGDFTGKCV